MLPVSKHDAHSSLDDDSSLMMSHPFLGEGDPSGGGVPVCNRHQVEGGQGVGDRDESLFPRMGWGTVMSHLFQGGSGGTVMSHPKGVCPRVKGDSIKHSQGEGVGANYVNVKPRYQPYYSRNNNRLNDFFVVIVILWLEKMISSCLLMCYILRHGFHLEGWT